MPYLREVFPKAEIVGCDPSAEILAIARRRTRACRFASMDELGPDAKFDLVIPPASLPYPAAGSADGHPLLLQPSERRRTLHHLRAQSDQSGHASSGQELSLRRGRGAAGHARDGRTHAQRASAYRRVELLPVLPPTARCASPVREISSLAADGRAVFRLRFQSKARRRLIAVFVRLPASLRNVLTAFCAP